jgi:uncharacterized protein with von Willebrand factor type A (vWA) domain
VTPLGERLLAFVSLLRENGVRVSTHETEDALAAIRLLDDLAVQERASLHALLSTTLVKNAADEEMFDRLFALHFRFHTITDARLAEDMRAALVARGMSEADADLAIERLSLASHDAERESLEAALVAGDVDRLLELFRRVLDDVDLRSLRSPLQVPYYGQRLLSRVGAESAGARLRARAQGGTSGGGEGGASVDGDDAFADEQRLVESVVDEKLLALRRLAQRLVREELEKRSLSREGRPDALLEKSLRALTPDDERRLKELVRRMCARLLARAHRRTRRARRGRLALKATLRKSLATDGVPSVVVMKRKRRERPEIVVLCDVSDSVRQASTFMLQFAYSLVELFRRVRGFVFVDRIGEVTEIFRRHSIDDAITRVMQGESVSVLANSDYGRALKEFAAMYLDGLTRKTTVVILGDGRTNQRPPEDWVVAEIRRRARQVVWLCPEEEGLWGFGDSRMPSYARHVDRVFVIRSLADLSRAIDHLVL